MVEEKLGGSNREVEGEIQMEDLDIWAPKKEVISKNHFRGNKVKERIDGEVDNSQGVLMVQIMPLKVVIGTGEEGGEDVPLTNC